MDSFTIVVAIIAFVAIVAKHSSVATHDSYSQDLRRRLIGYNDDKDEQYNMFLRRVAQRLADDEEDSDGSFRAILRKRGDSVTWDRIALNSVIGDKYCTGIGYNPSTSLSSCQSACLAMSSCTAVDFNPSTGQCTFRQCPTHPPHYEGQSGWQVWATELNLNWVQIASGSVIGANCEGVGYSPSLSLSSCQSTCMTKTYCTAVDFNPGTGQCTYRHCNSYPPKYGSQTGWQVWALHRETPTATAAKPLATAAKPLAAAEKPTAAAEKPTATAAKPLAAAEKPTASAAKPTATAEKPTATAEKPTATAAKPTATAAKPSATKTDSLSISSRCTEIVAGEDNYGGDMDAAHPAQVHSPAACAALCELYPDCIAWTFYAESGSCWPKNGIPILKTSSDHYTGRCKSA
ncbi:unnamed protein product [Adineta steineri]|uniref:Apple domain-containing protein n=1 Tax=Adineta steineri TaxID=433720 RepID=A0A819D4L3_9BILA|nr:unnamed protein product [Adineta steineri]CAF3817855.1 unnamed protein product [Adineta steineri]